MQQTFGNQRVQQALRPGQGRVRSPARPATEGAGAIYRHVSYEHRLLGDTKPGRIEEMVAVAEGTPVLAGDALRRAEAALGRIRHAPEPLDPVDARARLDAALAVTA